MIAILIKKWIPEFGETKYYYKEHGEVKTYGSYGEAYAVADEQKEIRGYDPNVKFEVVNYNGA